MFYSFASPQEFAVSEAAMDRISTDVDKHCLSSDLDAGVDAINSSADSISSTSFVAASEASAVPKTSCEASFAPPSAEASAPRALSLEEAGLHLAEQLRAMNEQLCIDDGSKLLARQRLDVLSSLIKKLEQLRRLADVPRAEAAHAAADADPAGAAVDARSSVALKQGIIFSCAGEPPMHQPPAFFAALAENRYEAEPNTKNMCDHHSIALRPLHFQKAMGVRALCVVPSA